MSDIVYETNFDTLKLLKRGKVRDIYELNEHYLIVATDRISAFDIVLPDAIPEKGRVLTQISLFWFNKVKNIIPNHVVTSDVNNFPIECQPYKKFLKERSILVKKTDPIQIECVVRGYLSGSGWNSYINNGSICGISLPKGLKESDKLESPIFTPSTKEEKGIHDINISFKDTCKIIGFDIANKIKNYSLEIYNECSSIAGKLGIIIADTKFEFGIINENEIIIIDELLTPDSSRFWPKSTYTPGGPQLSYDKQFVRDYLISINWNKKYPGPKLPEQIIQDTSKKYLEALQLFS